MMVADGKYVKNPFPIQITSITREFHYFSFVFKKQTPFMSHVEVRQSLFQFRTDFRLKGVKWDRIN